MSPIDLHVHSNCSDGSFTPSELVDYAIEKGLSAFALTDHDTTAGLKEAMQYASNKPVQVIPGIEFSTEYEGKDIHILGLFIQYDTPEFQDALEAFVNSRILRNQKMCQKLQAFGIDITYEKLVARFPGAVITRAHYAKFLLESGVTSSMTEAFERFIGDHASCFVPREKVTPAQAIALILKADGIPILAHPTLYHMSNARLEQLVCELKEQGLIGIEAIYSTYSTAEERQIRKLAAKYNLLISGGSDFHGSTKPDLELGTGYGKLYIPSSILEDLKSSLTYLLFSDMDGTLLQSDNTISDAMKKGLQKFSAQKNKLLLTSGRPLNSILEVVNQLGISEPGTLIIANNGALVYDCDTKTSLVEHRLPFDLTRSILRIGEEMGIHCQVYSDTHIIASKQSKELDYYQQRIHLPSLIAEDVVGAMEQETFKIMVIHLTDKSRLEALRERVLAEFSDSVQCIFSNDRYLEILPKKAGKGNAIRFASDYFHVPHSRTYAIGDAENDISMIQEAGTGIAMANAQDSVKEIADQITKNDNNHDGVLEIIQNLCNN